MDKENTDLVNHSFFKLLSSIFIYSFQTKNAQKENPIIIINRTNITEAMPTSIYIKISIT